MACLWQGHCYLIAVRDRKEKTGQEEQGERMTRKEIVQALLESPFFLDLNAWEKRETILAVEQASLHWLTLFRDK
jgi:hypothetical protein